MWMNWCKFSSSLCILLFIFGFPNVELTIGSNQLVSVTFLVAVNHTWDKCIATAKTPPLRPGTPYNASQSIRVGACDVGPLVFKIKKINKNDMRVDLVFYSSVIEDASPPSCSIEWTGNYLVPTTTWTNESLLPGCFTSESREGYHMTYYWFYVIDWLFE